MGRPRFDHLCGDCGGLADSRCGVAGRPSRFARTRERAGCCLPRVASVGARCHRPGWVLLFLSVDTSQKRPEPRSHIFLSYLAGTVLTALLTFAVIGCIGFAVQGEKFGEGAFASPFLFFGIAWAFWGIVFYLFLRNSSTVVDRIVSWLLRGSVLELLVAVPCHVIVRRRHECSAPMVTSFGIVTGIAIMLLSFGPGVLFLYRKRLDTYASRSSN